MLGRTKEAEARRDEGPPFPEPLRYLWEWFHEAAFGRSGGGFGPAQLSWQDLRAWSEMTATDLRPWEAKTILRLDALLMEAWEKQQASQSKSQVRR